MKNSDLTQFKKLYARCGNKKYDSLQKKRIVLVSSTSALSECCYPDHLAFLISFHKLTIPVAIPTIARSTIKIGLILISFPEKNLIVSKVAPDPTNNGKMIIDAVYKSCLILCPPF